MIIPKHEYHLGKKAFFLMVAKHVFPGFVLFLLTAVISSFGASLFRGIDLPNMSGDPVSHVSQMPLYISYGLNILFAASILAIIIGAVISWLEYQNYSFSFEEFNLVVKKGIFSREEVSIPYRQMQDINVSRNILHIMLGISRIVIDSAGHEEKDEHNETDIILELVDKNQAEDIRQFLAEKIGVQVVKNEK